MAFRPGYRRGLRVLALASVLAAVSAAGGCRPSPLDPKTGVKPDDRDVQNRIERYLNEQSQPATPERRWEDYRADEYQLPDQAKRLREQAGGSADKMRTLGQRIAEKPLEMPDALLIALDNNNEVLAGRAELKAIGGQELVTRARWSPRVNYILETQQVQRPGDRPFERSATDHLFRLSQTLFEFGRDNPNDVLLRGQQRDAMFGYEDIVRRVLSDVRRVYFTLILRQEQIAERRGLLAEFKKRFDEVLELEKVNRMREADVLTARLNVLNEELRINNLERELARQKIELLRLLGMPVDLSELRVSGPIEYFDIQLERAIDLALLRSTRVARSRAVVWEQVRLARQIKWENMPAVSARAGYSADHGATGVELDRDATGNYRVGGFVEGRPDERDVDRLLPPIGPFPFDDDQGWFARVFLDVPIFTGGEREGKKIREYARLERANHELREAVRSVEAEVGAALQTLRERRYEVSIAQERVQISRQRLRIQEKLKELGRIRDDELETFRDRFFADQDEYFRQQTLLIEAQEELRAAMRYFEPLPAPAEPLILVSPEPATQPAVLTDELTNDVSMPATAPALIPEIGGVPQP
jgi:outer membrane protein TolC